MSRFRKVFSILLVIMVGMCCAEADELGSFVDIMPEDDPYINDVIIPEENPQNPVGALENVSDGPDVFSLLLIGTDGYSSKINGRSDSMMLVRLNRGTGEIKIASFMRDLYVSIPGKGKTRLNAAFVYGGADLLRETLFNNFGVSADAYIAVNFAIMKELVDDLGGVDVTITKSEMNQINKWMADYYKQARKRAAYTKLKESGDVHLDGDQALAFSRIRNIDSDYERTRRQRDVIQAVFKKVMTLNKLEIAALVVGSIGKVQTDITVDDALKLAPLVLSVDRWDMATLRIPADKCYSSEMISGMAVLVPNLQKNKEQLELFFGE